MKAIKNGFYNLLFFGGLLACKKNENKCNNLQFNITASTIASQPCSANGSIQILLPIGSSYQYKIGNQTFQRQPIFSNIKVGKHTIVVRNKNGCDASIEIEVDTIVQGNKFNEVRHILANRCAGCHSGNNPQAGLNFTEVCDMLKHWDRIEARAVQGIPSSMPQTGLIPQEERNKIVEWIKAGHLYSN